MFNFKLKLYLIILITAIFILYPTSIQADAWWGEGYRDPEWVLRHGGTIINYKIKNTSSRHKVRMYLENDVVETEIGNKGVFDDAINNIYKLIVFKGTKKKISTVVTAHPGETMEVVFDIKKRKATMATDYNPVYTTPDYSTIPQPENPASNNPMADEKLSDNQEEEIKYLDNYCQNNQNTISKHGLFLFCN